MRMIQFFVRMKMKQALKNETSIAEPQDIDDVATVAKHKRVIESNPLLYDVYDHWYKELAPSAKATERLPGRMIEIGCGSSHIEKYISNVTKTDCISHFNAELVVNAEELPFEGESLRVIFMAGVLHHLSNPKSFFREADRCLVPGGRIAMVEPSGTLLANFMIRNFHPYETHDLKAVDWINHNSGRLSGANNALPSIIFERDRAIFEREFPRLKILSIRHHTFLQLYASGGYSYHPFLPASLLPVIRFVERTTSPLHRWLGLSMTVIIEKST
jgi:SAM-dependent methyltransferase